jgi:hypothetical protein
MRAAVRQEGWSIPRVIVKTRDAARSEDHSDL